MTDQLEELFARSRAEALPAIRPPGVTAARHTVRRRRQAGTAAAAVAALVALGAAPVVVRQVADRWAPPTAPVAGAAYAAVLGGAPRTPAVEFEGPVQDGYERRVQVYVPSLMLRVACSGEGRFTVVVDGRPDDRGDPRELARAAVTCGERPVAVQREFALSSPITSEVVVRLANAGTAAAGRAEFAYRLTALRAVPGAGPDDPVNSPVEELSRPGDVLRDAGAGSAAPSYEWTETGGITPVAGREYTVAAACTGWGLIYLQLRDREGIPVADGSVPCSRPPIRHDVEVGVLEPGTTVWLRYESWDKTEAQYAWAAFGR